MFGTTRGWVSRPSALAAALHTSCRVMIWYPWPQFAPVPTRTIGIVVVVILGLVVVFGVVNVLVLDLVRGAVKRVVLP